MHSVDPKDGLGLALDPLHSLSNMFRVSQPQYFWQFVNDQKNSPMKF